MTNKGIYPFTLSGPLYSKLSYDIISLIGLIDHVKRAADRYVRNENRIVSASLNNSESRSVLITNDINEVVSELGNIVSDQLSPIVAGGRSGLGTLTDLGNPIGLGNLTAASVQRGQMSRAGRLKIILSTHLLKLNTVLMPHRNYPFPLIIEVQHLFSLIPLKAPLILMIIILWGELSLM